MDSTASSGFPKVARFRFLLEAHDDIRLPSYPGSAWRGVIGRGLRRTACVTRQPDCSGCLLIQGCVYSTLFETPPPPQDAERGFSAVPHPYVLEIDPKTPRILAAGSPFQLTLALMGQAIGQAPFLIHALGSAGQLGIGKGQGRFGLVAVEQEEGLGTDRWSQVYDAELGEYRPLEPAPVVLPQVPTAARVLISTPLRIKRGGHFVGARQLSAPDFLRSLYQRLRQLASLYGGDPACFDAERLSRGPQGLEILDRRLSWHEWTRFSSRQDGLMQMGGLIGDLLLAGSDLQAAWPALWLGQWTHVGKGTTFGLGRYRIEPGTPEAAFRAPAGPASLVHAGQDLQS